MFTDKAPATPEVSGDILFGSFNTRRESVEAAGTKNGVEYLVNYSDYNSDGFRQQSANDKRQATAKLGIKIAEDTKLTMITSWFDQFAQDPGGLTAANLATNPTLASPNNVTANARVIRSNTQTGFNFEKIIDTNNSINFVTYGGQRSNVQHLFSGVFSPTFNGRASSINRDFYGFDGNWTHKGNLDAKPFTITAGLNFGSMVDNRKDESTLNGNIGNNVVRLNQKQVTQNFDQYIQGKWSAAERIDLHGGIRNTTLKMNITDRLGISSGGELEFNQTNPVAGIVFKASPTLNFYANAGRGFETPTMIEVTVNNAATGAGPNLNMKPSTSTNLEIGSKWLVSDNTKINTAVFDVSTKNEIVIATSNSGTGFTSYTNAGKTKRTGLELSGETKISKSLTAYLAYTWLDAKFDEDFTSNSATVKAGNNIPGTYRSQIYTELDWKYQPLNYNLALESRYNSKVYVKDSANTTSDSYLIFSVRTSLTQNVNNWKITEYARIDNIFDKTYVGSVRVNDSNSRFFEPAPGRNWIMGVKANYMF
jgi:iron complex outermembrane receptor protein